MQNCYSSQGLDRDERHSQDERLTKKHLETLTFLKELGLENKQLKARVEELEAERHKCKDIHAFAEESKARLAKTQEQFLKRTDEVTTMMAEKHRTEMLQQAHEKLDMEQSLQAEMDQLRAEVWQLQTKNKQLLQDSSLTQQLTDNTTFLKQQLEEAQNEVEKLHAERNSEPISIQPVADLEQIEKVKATNVALTGELGETNQKNRELKFRISKLEKELEDAISEKADTELLESLKNRLAKLHNEKSALVEREKEYNVVVNNMHSEILQLKQALSQSDTERLKLKKEYGGLVAQIVGLKRQLRAFQDKQNFKDFVTLRREIGTLKEENIVLKQQSVEKRTSLPMLKAPVLSAGDSVAVVKEKRIVLSNSATKRP